MRGWWVALVTVLALSSTPFTALAAHAECQREQHGCDQAALTDDCCCDHLGDSASPLTVSSDHLWVSPDAQPLASVPAVWSVVRTAFHTEAGLDRSFLVVDRLTLFRVLVI